MQAGPEQALGPGAIPRRRLTLLGEVGDFRDPPGPGSPDWPYRMLRRSLPTRLLCLDELPLADWAGSSGGRRRDLARILSLRAALAGDDTPLLAQSEASGYPAALALALSGSRRPLHIIFHGHRWWTRRRRAYAALIRRMTNVTLLCLSQSLRALAIEAHGLAPERVLATGYGVDGDFFRPATGDGPACIVAAGSASRDYRTLVQAAVDLAAPLEIAADSTWYVEPLNLQGDEPLANVRIFSAGDYAGLRRLYARARVVVVPLQDVRYACGYAVIAEAMAMGKAVIATRTAAPSDLIEDGVTGLYVPPGDVGALRAAVAGLLADPGRAEAMGRAGRAAVERAFSLRAYTARLAAVMGLDISPVPRPPA